MTYLAYTGCSIAYWPSLGVVIALGWGNGSCWLGDTPDMPHV